MREGPGGRSSGGLDFNGLGGMSFYTVGHACCRSGRGLDRSFRELGIIEGDVLAPGGYAHGGKRTRSGALFRSFPSALMGVCWTCLSLPLVHNYVSIYL